MTDPTDSIPARLAALKTTPLPELKAQWRTLFETEPPQYNRRALENRLAYRIQELAYGGLKLETRRRLEALGDIYDSGNLARRRIRHDARPVIGTKLIRTWQGVEQTVTVIADGYEWEGRPYRSLSAIARAITGTRWNGLVFFGLKRQGERDMTKPTIVRKLRCAVYTRKSSEEGLEQEFNSLHAQREACEAYVASQRSEGWALIREPYDDGGWSGGTLERPALKRLLADIEEGLIDVVVVYKIDRLSRALMDFSRLVEVFDRSGVTFVSVTQSFNTTTSMGRLTLNILLSFAQFEREVTAERIRDKIAASRAKGLWMGGNVPLGYVVKDRKLVVDEADAAIVRAIFERFVRIGSATILAQELRREGVRSRRGKLIDKGYLYKLLNNQTYLGLAVHKGATYPGEHAAIIDQALWDKVHAILSENTRTRSANTRAQTPALLKGLIFGPTGAAMSPTHTRKGARLYRYYVSQDVLKRGPGACPVGRVPAAEIEGAVVHQLRGVFRQPEIVVGTWRAAQGEQDDITEDKAREALLQLDPLWDELFPAEQARIVQLLVERVDVRMHGVEVRLRPNGLAGLVREAAGGRRAAA